jgi:hypothetical protein
MQHNPTHFNIFKNNLSFNEGWAGNNVKNWWNYVTDYEECNLYSQKLNRKELKELCSNKAFSTKECLGAVMAWGSQNRKHGKMLFSRFDEIEPIIEELRGGRLDYIAAYKKFDEVWQKEKPLGMGAAYFTKLIFFCEPNHQGFIMDQWTSKSVNLLCDKNIIHLVQGYVSKKNDHHTYGQFCNIIQNIAEDLDLPAENVEIAMFSQGGHKKAKWRQYVVDNYKKRVQI